MKDTATSLAHLKVALKDTFVSRFLILATFVCQSVVAAEIARLIKTAITVTSALMELASPIVATMVHHARLATIASKESAIPSADLDCLIALLDTSVSTLAAASASVCLAVALDVLMTITAHLDSSATTEFASLTDAMMVHHASLDTYATKAYATSLA
jgi:hypothetical protein